LQDLGISKKDFENNIDMLITCCFEDATSVMTPRSITDEFYRKLYYYAYEGKNIDF
jgi:hypothetical protein